MARAYVLQALLLLSSSSIYHKPRPQWVSLPAIAATSSNFATSSVATVASNQCKQTVSTNTARIWLISYRQE